MHFIEAGKILDAFSVLVIISDEIATMDIGLDEKSEMLNLIGDWVEKITTKLLLNLCYAKDSIMRTYD